MFKSALLTVALVSACAFASAEVLSNPLYSGGGDHASPTGQGTLIPGVELFNPTSQRYNPPTNESGSRTVAVVNNPLYEGGGGHAPSTDEASGPIVVAVNSNPPYSEP